MIGTHSIETATNAVGAVSLIRLMADDLAGVFDALGIRSIDVGQMKLVSLMGIDEALIARFEPGSLVLMPHGGIGITRAISQALGERGIGLVSDVEPLMRYPEAEDIHEARMLDALASARSPMAVDVLLDQPRRWREMARADGLIENEHLADSVVLGRLLEPPVVVAVGRANIGKSSLVNALAGKSVAMVSDVPGTTRDHVGVMLNLGGLVVRWVDAPGVDERVDVGEELALVEPVIRGAALVVHAIDFDDAEGILDPRLSGLIGDGAVYRVGVRSDLGGGPMAGGGRGVECSCSSQTGAGIQELCSGLRGRLVPVEALDDPRPWRFWES